MINKNTSGSQWRKWDLHIHSTASDGDTTSAEIIDKAKEKGLSVIALTDHHSVDNIDEIKELGAAKGIMVIAGIEFRSEYGRKSVHFIGLFPDEHNGTQLNAKALNELILCKLNLSKTEIISKGKEAGATKNDNDAFKKGMFLVQVDFKVAATLIHEYGGIISVHNGSKENGLDKEVQHQGTGVRNTQELYDSLGTVKKELMNDYIDICEIRKENDSEDFYLKTFYKPSIIASDAHKKNEIGQHFTWIKADPTFEGLKQIIYEPEERVRIQELIPEEKNDYQVIESIAFNNETFGEQVICFNQNLNTIIGGRSSGKSILLGCVAKLAGFTGEIKKENEQYNNGIAELIETAQITWRDKTSDTVRYIDYFSQSQINSLTHESGEVNKIVEGIIKTYADKKNNLDTYSNFIITNRTSITNKLNEWITQKTRIEELEEQIEKIGNEKGIETQIEKLTDELAKIKGQLPSSLTVDEEKEYDTLKGVLLSNDQTKKRLSSDISNLYSLKDIEIFNSIDTAISSLSQATKKGVEKFYAQLRIETKQKFIGFVDSQIDLLSKEVSRIEKQTEEINNSALYKRGLQFSAENKVYSEKEEQLKIERVKLTDVKKLREEQYALKESKKTNRNDILALHFQYYNKLTDVSAKIPTQKEDVEISAQISFAKEKFNDRLSSSFNKKTGDGKHYLNFSYQDFDSYKTQITTIFDRIDNNAIHTRDDIQQVLVSILSDNYFSLDYKVEYENDDLDSMSEGKKAFIILRLLLDFTEKASPILIDQPEDDLDNRAIYDQLVLYLRTKKKQRQIILVTHNPNIVVGADSELVIVANQNGAKNKNQEDVKFEYFTGSIETTFKDTAQHTILLSQGIREHVCDILEGGDRAFQIREKKYGYK